MANLTELNAFPHRSEWSSYVLDSHIGVGKVGRRWKQGEKVHLVFARVVVGYTTPGYVPPAGHFKLGDTLSARTPCNSNGQNIARVVDGWDTDQVTCATCLKTLATLKVPAS
jgi:hypothetical protein